MKKIPSFPDSYKDLYEKTKFRTLTIYGRDDKCYPDKPARVSCASTIVRQDDKETIYRVSFSFCSPKEKNFWKKFGHRIAFLRLIGDAYVDVVVKRNAKSISKTLYELVCDLYGQKEINAPNWLRKYAITENEFDNFVEITNYN